MTYETAYQLLQVIFRTYFMVKSNLSQIRYQPNSPLQLSCCQRFLRISAWSSRWNVRAACWWYKGRLRG